MELFSAKITYQASQSNKIDNDRNSTSVQQCDLYIMLIRDINSSTSQDPLYMVLPSYEAMLFFFISY